MFQTFQNQEIDCAVGVCMNDDDFCNFELEENHSCYINILDISGSRSQSCLCGDVLAHVDTTYAFELHCGLIPTLPVG